jgi:hypothetical protein
VWPMNDLDAQARHEQEQADSLAFSQSIQQR